VLLRHRPVFLDWAIVVVLCVGTVVGWALDRAHQPGWALPLLAAARPGVAAFLAARSAVVVAVDVVQIVADVGEHADLRHAHRHLLGRRVRLRRRRHAVGTYVGIRRPAVTSRSTRGHRDRYGSDGGRGTPRRQHPHPPAYLPPASVPHGWNERDAQAATPRRPERTRRAGDADGRAQPVGHGRASRRRRLRHGRSPDHARRAIATVAETGRQALTEMHGLLALRSTHVVEDLTPQPGVDQLDAPIYLTSPPTAGHTVRAGITGTAQPRPALTVYRIVQGADQHPQTRGPSGHGHRAARYLAHHVEIEITDNGHLAGVPRTGPMIPDGGHGITGMRERTAVYGGSLHACPTDGAGWRICARLPVEAPR
jgi:hypothetical protein